MSLPKRPATLAELEASLAAGTLQEGQHLEFKRELPSNKEIARQCAALAVQGGVLVLGAEETSTGFVGSPIDYIGVREKVGQIAQDTPEPPVELESLVLQADEPSKGVVWVEIAPSPHMLHQVGGRYYKRDDARTRPMSHAEVTDRIALREARPHMLKQGIEKALQRPEPAGTPLHARTCVVARPIGAAPDELFARTNTTEEWDNFAYDLMAPTGPIMMPAPVRAWGFISHQATPDGATRSAESLMSYRDIVFEKNGALAHLSYSRGPDRRSADSVQPWLALQACLEVIGIIGSTHERIARSLPWDIALSIRGVKGHTGTSRPWVGARPDPRRFQPTFPRDDYTECVVGVTARRLRADRHAIVQELAGQLVLECGLDFDAEYPGARTQAV